MISNRRPLHMRCIRTRTHRRQRSSRFVQLLDGRLQHSTPMRSRLRPLCISRQSICPRRVHRRQSDETGQLQPMHNCTIKQRSKHELSTRLDANTIIVMTHRLNDDKHIAKLGRDGGASIGAPIFRPDNLHLIISDMSQPFRLVVGGETRRYMPDEFGIQRCIVGCVCMTVGG